MQKTTKSDVPILPLSPKCIEVLSDEYMELQNLEQTTKNKEVKKIAKHKKSLIIDLLQGYERQ